MRKRLDGAWAQRIIGMILSHSNLKYGHTGYMNGFGGGKELADLVQN